MQDGPCRNISYVSATDPKWNKFGRTRDDEGKRIPNPFIGRVVQVSFNVAGVNRIYANAKAKEAGRAEHKERIIRRAEEIYAEVVGTDNEVDWRSAYRASILEINRVQEHKWADHFQGSRNILTKKSDPSMFYLNLYPQMEDASWKEFFYYDLENECKIAKHVIEDFMSKSKKSDFDPGIRSFKLGSIVLANIDGEVKYVGEGTPYLNVV